MLTKIYLSKHRKSRCANRYSSMKYVCTGATLKCTMGTDCPKLVATPKNVSLTGQDQANVADYVPIKNVPGFGRCHSLGYPPTAAATAANHGKLTPMPCVPGTCQRWNAIDRDSLICGEPALLEPATLQCMYGGTISIVNPGQSLEIKIRGVVSFSQKGESQQEEAMQEMPEELLQEFNSLDRSALTTQSVLDGVQAALDVWGMAPGVGAIPDLMNAAISVMRGDWVGAGLSIVAAVPVVGDAVGGVKIAYRGIVRANRTKKIESFKAAITNGDHSFFIDKNISSRQLMRNGMSAEESDAFLKKVKTLRKRIARDFIKKQNPSMNMKDVYSHVNCIETANSVIIKKIPPPNKYIRYECIDGKFGEYITYQTNPPPSAESLGILSYQINDGVIKQKILRVYSVSGTEQFEVMQSTARRTKAPIDGNWKNRNDDNLIEVAGGAIQVYIPISNKNRFLLM